MAQVFPDDSGKVRNVQVMVKPKQGGAGSYFSTKPIYLNRHVSNIIVLVPVDEQGNQLSEFSGSQQDVEVVEVSVDLDDEKGDQLSELHGPQQDVNDGQQGVSREVDVELVDQVIQEEEVDRN